MNAIFIPFSKIISSDEGSREHYHVPKYQREYSWGKKDWDRLLQDIEENDAGYFMGSVICVRDSEGPVPGDEIIYELIDGQQRLTTLSLLLMAVYHKLTALKSDGLEFGTEDEQDEFNFTLRNLRHRLVKKKKTGDFRPNEIGGWKENDAMLFLRVQPSSQSHNLDDYRYILGELDIIETRKRPRYHGVRAIRKAFQHFIDHLPADTDALRKLINKVSQLSFVHITVDSQADAFTLFETLNNRGVPLSAIDIIKNKILAEMEKQHRIDIDASYERWQEIVNSIPDASDQERFLRHFYNAFRWNEDVRVDGVPRAVKAKLITVYETMIKRNARGSFDRLMRSAKTYGQLINPDDALSDQATRDKLTELIHIGAAPAYQILLYLFTLDEAKTVEDDFLIQAIDLLCKYYIRRNVTDIPGTAALDQGHTQLIAACQAEIESSGQLTFEFFRDSLLVKGTFASLDDFRRILLGDMYSNNSLITRYLLSALDQAHNTREYRPDLWARDDRGRLIWTIEHVLPQSENIPQAWIDMIADGNAEEAARIHEQHVHRLGNLTLSGYNANLSKRSFAEKQTQKKDYKVFGQHINIEYQNGLALNAMPSKLDGSEFSLATASEWTGEMIDARTEMMVDRIIEMFRFEDR
ncbi:MAG: DUF262 domain-containing protein [Phycisphaerales bacterium]